MEAARVLSGAEYRTALKARLAAGARSFAAARQAAVEAVCPGTGLAALLDKPNNNLAVEYCKAILELGLRWCRSHCPGRGAGHGQALTETGGSLPVPAPCARSGRTAERMPLLLMFRRKSCRSTGKPLPPGSTPILRPPSAAAGASAQPAQEPRRLPRCGAFRKVWSTGWKPPCVPAPPMRTAGQPDHRALPPGTDAPPGDGCRSGPPPMPSPAAALPPPAGGAEGCPSPPGSWRCPVSHSLARLARTNAPAPRWLPPSAGPVTLVRYAGKSRSRWGGISSKIIFLTN